MNRKFPFLISLILLILSCETRVQKEDQVLDQVVLISKNHPYTSFKYYLNQRSITDTLTKSGPVVSGSTQYLFIDEHGEERFWFPKLKEQDTLVIKTTNPIFEITNQYLPLTKKPISWLIEKGDTLEFEYKKDGLIWAKILNRTINDTVLNYDNYKILLINKQQFDPDDFPYIGLEGKLAKKRQLQTYEDERQWMVEIGLNQLQKNYRTSSQPKLDLSSFSAEEKPINYNEVDWSIQDSLFQYRYFRNDLRYRYSKYNLALISVNYNNEAGFSDIDQKKRFDSILKDTRYSTKIQDFLLLETYKKIIRTYSVDEIEHYTELMRMHHSDSIVVQEIIEKNNLNFKTKDRIELIDVHQTPTTLNEVLLSSNKKYKVLYFWATWCAPCKKLEPKWNSALETFKDQNIEFYKLALNDNFQNWVKANGAENSYLISNSKSSKKLEEYQVNTIPRFILLDKDNNIIHMNLSRPGRGFVKQLQGLTP